MDLHGLWESQLYCPRIDDLLDGKWTDELRGQFLGFHSEWNVLSGKPHHLTHLVGRSLGAPLIN